MHHDVCKVHHSTTPRWASCISRRDIYVHDPLTTISNEYTFLKDFLVILKRKKSLRNISSVLRGQWCYQQNHIFNHTLVYIRSQNVFFSQKSKPKSEVRNIRSESFVLNIWIESSFLKRNYVRKACTSQ